MMGVPTNQ